MWSEKPLNFFQPIYRGRYAGNASAVQRDSFTGCITTLTLNLQPVLHPKLMTINPKQKGPTRTSGKRIFFKLFADEILSTKSII